MKRILTLVLALLMIVFTASCFGDASTPSATTSADTTPAGTTPGKIEVPKAPLDLKAGYGRVSISPSKEAGTLPISLSGGGTAVRVFNDIYASAIAIDDGTTTIILMTLDLRDITTGLFTELRTKISQLTDVPEGNIMIATTHTHSAPEVQFMDGLSDRAVVDTYIATLKAEVPKAAVAAVNDLAPTTMSYGKSETDKLSFVRRYIMSDGSYGSISGATGTYVSHESEADTELQTIKFDRTGKQDIVMVNWQCHPAAVYPASTINSDWVHYLRKGVEANYGVKFAYFNGALGNINNVSKISGEAKYTGNKMVENIGNELVTVVGASMQNMKAIEPGYIQARSDKMPNAENRYNDRVNLFTCTIGEFALAANPFEMFHQLGEYVKDGSPVDATFFVCCAQGYESYMPTEEMYPHGGYEVDCSRFAGDRAFGDKTATRLLNTIKRLLTLD